MTISTEISNRITCVSCLSNFVLSPLEGSHWSIRIYFICVVVLKKKGDFIRPKYH